MATKKTPTSSYDEDSSFEKKHVAKSKVDAGDLKKMETEGTADLKLKDTSKERTKKSSELNEYFGRHRGQLASLLFIVVMLVVGITITILMSPSLLLVNIKENLVNDLNDGTKAYHVYSNKVLDMTSQGGDCDYQSDPSIKCKFHTMSAYMRDNFTKHGFTITPPEPPDPYESSPYLQMAGGAPAEDRSEEPERIATRVTADTHGNSIDGSLSETAANDSQFRRLLHKVYSPRTSMFQDRKFDQRLYYKFHITRGTHIGGSNAEEVKESFDSVVDGDGGDSINLNGQGNYGVAKLESSASQWPRIMSNLIADDNGMKVTSFATLSCAYDAYEKIAENAVINAHRVTVARYAMNYLSAADTIKAGYAKSPITSMVLSGTLINNGDNATDATSYRTPALHEDVDGPVDAADPSKYLSILTAPGTMMGTLKDHQLEAFAEGVGLTSPASPPGDGILNPKSDDPYGWCTAAQSPSQKSNNEIKLVPMIPPTWYCNTHPQSLGTVLGFGLAAAAKALESAYYIAPAQAIACQLLEDIPIRVVSRGLSPLVQGFADMSFSVVRSMLQSEAVPYLTEEPTSKEVQDAIFAGTGIILGDMAQSRGLKPVTMNDTPAFTQYLEEASAIHQQTINDKIALARSEPFNIYNRYSFLGMAMQNMFGSNNNQKATTTLSSLTRVLGMFGSSINSAMAVISPSTSAMFSQPLDSQFDISRLSQCPFNGNNRFWGKDGINITSDFGCNIRYFMPKAVLDMDIDNVIDYMTQDPQPTDVDWAQENIDQLNEREASGRDSARLSKLKQEAQNGKNASFIDAETGKPNPDTQYERFLQYCVYRKDPWGASALAVDWAPPEFDHNPEYYYGKDVYSMYENTFDPDDSGDTATSYYAAGAGSKIDQDWYTGKNCLEDNNMINNFRAYTLACSVLASMSGSRECWNVDEEPHDMPNDFFLTNDILFLPNQSASGFGAVDDGSTTPPAP